ncbi:MAG: serine/threonine protein kinase [Deltaproteobacteria bacterium]|nr:serine/threonine protein kinase [Deltaproteobacteria bacterium]
MPCQNCGASVPIPRRGGMQEVAPSGLGIHPALMKKYQNRQPNIPSEFEVNEQNASVQLSPSLVNEKEALSPDDDVDLHSEVERARERSSVVHSAPEHSTTPGRKRATPPDAKETPQQPIQGDIETPPQGADDDEAAKLILPTIPGFTLRGTVGSGAMGHVYRATDDISGELAAVKVLAPELAARPDFVARFEREAAALRAVDHPAVVSIQGSGSVGDLHFLTMDYVEGKSLRRLLDGGGMAPGRAIGFARQIAQGLGAAHSCGVIHRDLKPENILVQRMLLEDGEHEERLVLVDFGLAGMNEESDPHPNLTKSRMTMGTVNYMAPEQRTDAKRVDERADIYALGVILYELLTGDLPLGRFKLPTERGLKLPLSIDECISKTLDREREKRFADCVGLDRALRAIEEELEKAASQRTVIGRSSPREASIADNDTEAPYGGIPSANLRTDLDTAPEFSAEASSAAGESAEEYGELSTSEADEELVEDDEHWDDESDAEGFNDDNAVKWSDDVTEKAMRPKQKELGRAASLPIVAIAIAALIVGGFLAWALSRGGDDEVIPALASEMQAKESSWRLPTGWLEHDGIVEVDAQTQPSFEMARLKKSYSSSSLRAEGVLHFTSSKLEGYGAFFFISEDGQTQVGVAIQNSGEVHLLKLHKNEVNTKPLVLKAAHGEKVLLLCSVAQKKCNIQVGDAAEKAVDVPELGYSKKWVLGLGCRDANCRFEKVVGERTPK